VAGGDAGVEQSYRFGFHRLGSVLVVSVLVGLATIGGLIFAPDDGGTIVTVVHAGLPAADTEQHRLGWAHFLDRRRPRPRPLGRSAARPAQRLDRVARDGGSPV